MSTRPPIDIEAAYRRIQYRVEFIDLGYRSPCHIWQGPKDGKGYGRISINGTLYQTHRICFEYQNGSIAPGLQTDHLCRVRACCNPDHMEAVTPRENIRRGNRCWLTLEQASNRKRTHNIAGLVRVHARARMYRKRPPKEQL